MCISRVYVHFLWEKQTFHIVQPNKNYSTLFCLCTYPAALHFDKLLTSIYCFSCYGILNLFLIQQANTHCSVSGGGGSEMAQVHFKETNCLHTSVIYVNDFLRNSRKHWYQPRNEPRPPCLTTLTTNTCISQVFVHIFIRNHIQW